MEEGRAAAALEAALLLGARAIANRDGEFGRELCRRAGGAIFDPRICAMMGECDELGGDTLEAICAYRAALTLDTSAGGRPLPAEARQRARDRLTALAKKAGLSESWGNVQRKAAEVTPASIEQQLRANRLGEAVQAYKQSPEYKGRTKARFHLAVGRVFKEFAPTRALAREAFDIAIAAEASCSGAMHEKADLLYEDHEYRAAMEWYEKALRIEPKHAMSRSGVANCEKDLGNLHEAVKHYQQAVALAPADPTFAFNLAQAYEYTQQYDKALDLLERFCAALQPADMSTVNHFAVPLLYVKLVFVAGPRHHPAMPPLLQQIAEYPEVATKAVQALATHWAYYYFLKRLTAEAISPLMNVPADECPPALYFVGDSHVLSPAWCRLPLLALPLCVSVCLCLCLLSLCLSLSFSLSLSVSLSVHECVYTRVCVFTCTRTCTRSGAGYQCGGSRGMCIQCS